MSSRADPLRVEVVVAGRTDTGRTRTENQDTFLALELSAAGAGDSGDGFVLKPSGNPEEGGGGERSFSLGPGGALFLVADGMGGAAGGATASHLAVTSVAEEMRRHRASDGEPAEPHDFAIRLQKAVQQANSEIQERAESEPELQGMGTTFTGAGVLGRSLVLAQVGDSRGYLLRDGDLVQLTRDQSVVQEMIDAGAMTPEEARRSPQRNMILQALGTSPSLDVVCSELELHRGDVLLLCSDGLCGVVGDDAMARTLRDAPDLDQACQTLVDQANEGGGPDNITVLLVRVDGEDLEPPPDGADTRPHPLQPPEP